MTSIFPARRAPDNLPRPVHWTSRAVCRDDDVDPDAFFPLPTDLAGIEDAKRLCRRCPVQMRCRTDALNRGEEHGVWGGLDENELRAVRKVRRAAQDQQDADDRGALATAG